MKVYKLTDQNHETRNATKWGVNVTHTTPGTGDLCGPGWLHHYSSPELAVLLNPTHADFDNPVLWEARAAEKHKSDCGLKGGSSKLTTVKILPLPTVTTEQRIKFGIYCALEVCKEAKFVTWAKAWLDGSDRTKASAESAAARSAESAAARSAARAAARAAESAAESAASSAALAAESAARAVRAVRAAAAAESAESAAWAAAEGKKANFSFLQRCAEKALKIV